MKLIWTEYLSVGNAVIDSEHKQLIAMINGAEYMVKKGDRFALSEALGQIEQYFRTHFLKERMNAQGVKFSFAENKLEHECMLRAIYLLKDVIEGELDGLNGNSLEQYIELLSDGLTIHILKEAMQAKSAHSYDREFYREPEFM